jgi:hypothetical protein
MWHPLTSFGEQMVDTALGRGRKLVDVGPMRAHAFSYGIATVRRQFAMGAAVP